MPQKIVSVVYFDDTKPSFDIALDCSRRVGRMGQCRVELVRGPVRYSGSESLLGSVGC
jgi:hypothetical protein